jgi:hypothetical protein
MPILPHNRGERTVLSYVKLDFLGDWEYVGDDFSFRPVGVQADLLVVTEEPTGSLVTYWFVVRRRDSPPGGGPYPTDGVMVPKEENIVYIPERCVKREEGDKTECRAL